MTLKNGSVDTPRQTPSPNPGEALMAKVEAEIEANLEGRARAQAAQSGPSHRAGQAPAEITNKEENDSKDGVDDAPPADNDLDSSVASSSASPVEQVDGEIPDREFGDVYRSQRDRHALPEGETYRQRDLDWLAQAVGNIGRLAGWAINLVRRMIAQHAPWIVTLTGWDFLRVRENDERNPGDQGANGETSPNTGQGAVVPVPPASAEVAAGGGADPSDETTNVAEARADSPGEDNESAIDLSTIIVDRTPENPSAYTRAFEDVPLYQLQYAEFACDFLHVDRSIVPLVLAISRVESDHRHWVRNTAQPENTATGTGQFTRNTAADIGETLGPLLIGEGLIDEGKLYNGNERLNNNARVISFDALKNPLIGMMFLVQNTKEILAILDANDLINDESYPLHNQLATMVYQLHHDGKNGGLSDLLRIREHPDQNGLLFDWGRSDPIQNIYDGYIDSYHNYNTRSNVASTSPISPA